MKTKTRILIKAVAAIVAIVVLVDPWPTKKEKV